MKRILTAVLCVMLLLGLIACAAPKTEETKTHTIGVLTYSLTDGETAAFREYLEGYIAPSFEDVDFLYSDNVTSPELELQSIDAMAQAGVEGILSFISFDLTKEVSLCAEKGIYYLMASGTVDEEAFAENAANPYFLGVIGPGTQMEYHAGFDMAAHFAAADCKEFLILSGGSALGNAMHLQRCAGMWDALQTYAGDTCPVNFASVTAPTEVTLGQLRVQILPGYYDDALITAVSDTCASRNIDCVLSVMLVEPVADCLGGAKAGAVDCYDAQNSTLFQSGLLHYLTGKYESIIAPSFAVMYNAVTGFAADFRDAGNAFVITQGFWVSDSREDFLEKYALSSGIALNAYSIDDLLQVLKQHNPRADLQDIQDLASHYDFPSALARRGN